MILTNIPTPPYYAVIFNSMLKPNSSGYQEANGAGVTISYWSSLESLKTWKQEREHRKIQERGKSEWYSHYRLRVAKVEEDYQGP